jgi:hypothetical protein
MTYTPIRLPQPLLPTQNVSIAGKIVNITGNGLHTDISSSVAKVYVVCGDVSKQLDILLALGNLTQILMTGNSPQTCTFNSSFS